jgi:SAM-dependent methyltransferase
MPATDQAGTAPVPGARSAYGRDAARYDARTADYDMYRRRAIDALPLAAGDVVVDVGCGTGLCFGPLLDRIGPAGIVIGVEPAAQMRALAAERIAARGWGNVLLIGSPVEAAELPAVDHALFCAVHDVLQSPAALDSVLAHVREGGGVVATGGKWAPPWALLINAGVLAAHAPFVRNFAGFSRPWEPLAERVPGLSVEEVAWGGGYLAWGSVRRVARGGPRA